MIRVESKQEQKNLAVQVEADRMTNAHKTDTAFRT